MHRLTVWLWLVFVGAVLQLGALTTKFYVYEGDEQSAWMGIPTTSELILFSAIVALANFLLTAGGRPPVSGKTLGKIVGAAGLIAGLQLAYRMIAPPFGGRVPEHATIIGDSCLYWCPPGQAEPAQLLPGIWVALAGCIAVAIGGFLHSRTRTAEQTPAVSWAAPVQSGLTPWLALAALGVTGLFVFGFTLFTFFRTIGTRGETTWSGWLPMPHTASLTFAVTATILALVWAASKYRAPLNPAALGALIAVLASIATSRVLYRIIEPPFGRMSDLEIGPAAYVAVAAGLMAVFAGIMQALTQRDARERPESSPAP